MIFDLTVWELLVAWFVAGSFNVGVYTMEIRLNKRQYDRLVILTASVVMFLIGPIISGFVFGELLAKGSMNK